MENVTNQDIIEELIRQERLPGYRNDRFLRFIGVCRDGIKFSQIYTILFSVLDKAMEAKYNVTVVVPLNSNIILGKENYVTCLRIEEVKDMIEIKLLNIN